MSEKRVLPLALYWLLLGGCASTQQPQFSSQALRAEAQVRKEAGDVQGAAEFYAQLACNADAQCKAEDARGAANARRKDASPIINTAVIPEDGASAAGTSVDAAAKTATKNGAFANPGVDEAGGDAVADACKVDADSVPGALQSAAYARQWVDMWDAAERSAVAWGALRDCKKSEPFNLYVDSLQAGAMATWERADGLLAKAEDLGDLAPAWRAELALRRATVALHQGQATAAFAHLDRARGAVPERTDIYLVTAQARLAAREYSEAVSTLRPLLQLQPTAVELERAQQIVATAVEESQPPMAPTDNAAVRDLLGLLTQETLTDADLKHALSVATTRQVPRLMTVAGLVAFKQGQAEKGLQLLEVAQDKAPLDPDPPRLIGLHYVADNMPDAAIGPLVEAAKRNPFDPEIQVAIAQLAAVVGDLKLARTSYQNLMVLRPDVPMFQEERDRLDARLQVSKD